MLYGQLLRHPLCPDTMRRSALWQKVRRFPIWHAGIYEAGRHRARLPGGCRGREHIRYFVPPGAVQHQKPCVQENRLYVRENESLHLSLQEKRIVQDRLEHLHEELRRDIDRHSLRLVSAGLELLLDYCVRFYERQFACRTDIDGEYMEKLDKTLSQYFSLCGQKSVEGGISKVESALSSLSPAYLNDFVRAETGKTLAEYIRIRMMEYIKKRVHKEGCPLEQVAGEFGFYQPRLLALLYRQVFGCQPEHYLLTPDYKLN